LVAQLEQLKMHRNKGKLTYSRGAEFLVTVEYGIALAANVAQTHPHGLWALTAQWRDICIMGRTSNLWLRPQGSNHALNINHMIILKHSLDIHINVIKLLLPIFRNQPIHNKNIFQFIFQFIFPFRFLVQSLPKISG